MNWNNEAAVSEARSQQMKSAFVEELQGKQTEASAPATQTSCGVSVYLQKTPTQVVVTAKAEIGEAQPLFAAIPRAGMAIDNVGASAPRIEKELLWRQNEQILDAILVRSENGAADRLVVLSKDAVTVQQKQNGAWKVSYVKPLGDVATALRGARGALSYSPEQPEKLKISVGEKSCQTTLAESAAFDCTQANDSPRTGLLLASNCDTRVWWLRSDGGDLTMPDRLELVPTSAPQTQAQPAVAELPMPGPVLSISSGEALRADSAVVFNLGTGNYEVYRISLACGL
ncbi:MAG: hypothetical protein NVS9B14_24140 [Candidatus Acidiferrum sp.]